MEIVNRGVNILLHNSGLKMKKYNIRTFLLNKYQVMTDIWKKNTNFINM